MRATVLFLIWLVLTIFGLSRLSFNVEISALLPADLPEAEGIRELYRHFSRDDELILTLQAPDADTAAIAARELAGRLAGRGDLVRAAIWHLPFEERPDLAADLLAWLWLNAEPAAVTRLVDSLAPPAIDETLAETLEELTSGFLDEATMTRAYDPLGFTHLPGGLRESAGIGTGDELFASADGSFRVVYLEAPDREFGGYREVARWIAEVRSEIDAWHGETPGNRAVTVALTGEPAFVAEISTAMERDMKGSAIGTAVLIALLFWAWFRRLRPLLWLLLMLGLIFSGTFAAGGVIFGELSAMSIGFAAILLGLAVDYGVVLFRERHEAPGDARALRRIIGPGIVWAAATTAAVFATLNLASLPGIAELGTLVAVGTVIGAGVMLFLFAPVAARDAEVKPEIAPPKSGPVPTGGVALAFTALCLAAGVITLALAGPPSLRHGAKPFQLRDGESFVALEELESRLGSGDGDVSLPVVITADNWERLHDRLSETATRLEAAGDDGAIRDFLLPTALVPHPGHQAANRAPLAGLVAGRERLIAATLGAGFSEEATFLIGALADSWTTLLAEPDAGWVPPSSDLGRWLAGRAVSHPEDGKVAAVGRIQPAAMATDSGGHLIWAANVNGPGAHVTGWEVLDPALQALVAGDIRRVFVPMGLILTLMLALVFRDLRDLLLALGTLAFSGLALMTLSRWLPSVVWNTFNIAALPILFGTGLDHAIHMIFALRRSGGELAPVRRGISRALLFCGLSTGVGFGSLAFASSEGLASLGLVCALGIMLNMLAAIWLLPHWWRWTHRRVHS